MMQMRKYLVINLKVRRWKVGEAVFKIDSGQRTLHQAPSSGRDGFWVLHSLTFYNSVGEVWVEKHSIFDSWRSFMLVLPVENGCTLFHSSKELPQPSCEENLNPFIIWLAAQITRICFALSQTVTIWPLPQSQSTLYNLKASRAFRATSEGSKNLHLLELWSPKLNRMSPPHLFSQLPPFGLWTFNKRGLLDPLK